MAVRFFYVQHGQRPSFDKFGSLYCDSRGSKVRLGENMLVIYKICKKVKNVRAKMLDKKLCS